MDIQQQDRTAIFIPGEGYTSDDPSFSLWLNSTFPAKPYTSAEAHAAALRAHGLTVDGVADTPEPEPEPQTEPETPEQLQAREAAEQAAALAANPFVYSTPSVDAVGDIAPTDGVAMTTVEGGSDPQAWSRDLDA